MNVRDLDSAHSLNSGNPDALVLAILCDPKGLEINDMVAHIVQELHRLHGSRLDDLRNSLMKRDVLAANRNLQNLVKENVEMFVDVEKMGIYQLVMEKGVEKGHKEIVLRLLDKFSPEQTADLSGLSLGEVEAMAAAKKPR